MSGTYPDEPCFEVVNMRTRRRQSVSEVISLRRQVRDRVGHRFEFTCSYSPMSKADFNPVSAFLEAQTGQLETFQIVIPIESQSSGDVSGTVLANGAFAIGVKQITVDGFTGTLPAGDYVKWAGHDKVYRLTAGTTGPGAITISPPLVAAVADGEALVIDDVPFTVRQNGEVQEAAIQRPSRYRFEVDLLEAV